MTTQAVASQIARFTSFNKNDIHKNPYPKNITISRSLFAQPPTNTQIGRKENIKMKVELHPKICNICGGKVEYTRLQNIYGSYLKYGEKSGFCYHCKKCDATVGTHIDRPLEAYGLLANEEMRKLRQRNHDMFDKFWKNKQQRTKYYNKLAEEMGIPFEECHFAWFSIEELEKSYQIMLRWWREKYDH